jgi:hypothetical protein
LTEQPFVFSIYTCWIHIIHIYLFRVQKTAMDYIKLYIKKGDKVDKNNS